MDSAFVDSDSDGPFPETELGGFAIDNWEVTIELGVNVGFTETPAVEVRPIVVLASVVMPGIGELPLALFGAWLTDSSSADSNESGILMKGLKVEIGLSGATVDARVTPRVIPDSAVEPAILSPKVIPDSLVKPITVVPGIILDPIVEPTKVIPDMVPDSKIGLAALVPVTELDSTIKLETDSPV